MNTLHSESKNRYKNLTTWKPIENIKNYVRTLYSYFMVRTNKTKFALREIGQKGLTKDKSSKKKPKKSMIIINDLNVNNFLIKT